MAGKKHREKGNRFERSVVDALNAFGLEAKRVPLSGAAAGFKGDVHYKERGIPRVMECKVRKNAWKDLYDYLAEAEIDRLIIKRDGCVPIVCVPLPDYCILAGEE